MVKWVQAKLTVHRPTLVSATATRARVRDTRLALCTAQAASVGDTTFASVRCLQVASAITVGSKQIAQQWTCVFLGAIFPPRQNNGAFLKERRHVVAVGRNRTCIFHLREVFLVTPRQLVTHGLIYAVFAKGKTRRLIRAQNPQLGENKSHKNHTWVYRNYSRTLG